MEKNYIFRKDLSDIMEELTEEALNHADTMTTKVIFRKGEMSVCVTPHYRTLVMKSSTLPKIRQMRWTTSSETHSWLWNNSQ